METSTVTRASVRAVIQDRRSDVVHVEGSGDSTWYVEPLCFIVFDGELLASTLMLIRSDGPIRHDFIGRMYANKLIVDNTIWNKGRGNSRLT